MPVSALKLSPKLQQLLALGVDTEAFDRALAASPDYLGASPDDERVAIVEDTGCEEYYHKDDVVGGGYAIDNRGLLLTDRCISPTQIEVYSCPQQPQVSSTPVPTPIATQQVVNAVSRRVSCECQAILAPDKTETAKCVGR